MKQNMRALWEPSFWKMLQVFPMGPPNSYRMENLILVTRKDKSRKKLWIENININSQVVWTFDAVLSSKLHLELFIISRIMKSKLLWTLKEKGSWPGVDLLLAVPGGPLSVYVLSFYLAVGHVLPLGFFPALLNVKRDLFRVKGAATISVPGRKSVRPWGKEPVGK